MVGTGRIVVFPLAQQTPIPSPSMLRTSHLHTAAVATMLSPSVHSRHKMISKDDSANSKKVPIYSRRNPKLDQKSGTLPNLHFLTGLENEKRLAKSSTKTPPLLFPAKLDGESILMSAIARGTDA